MRRGPFNISQQKVSKHLRILVYNSCSIISAFGNFWGIFEVFPKRLFFYNSFDALTCTLFLMSPARLILLSAV